jgi:hypothetical protein
MSQTIPTGRYLGWDLARLEAKLATLQAEGEGTGGILVGSTISGQSFQWSDKRDGGNLDEQMAELQAALHFLAPHKYWAPPTNASAIRLC